MQAQYICPALTILDEKGQIDKEGNSRLYEHLLRQDISGILVLGSAGEFFGLSQAQRRELAEHAIRSIAGRTRVIIGTGSMSAKETIELSNHALGLGASAVMIVGPYYINLAPENVFAYYDTVASAIKGEIYLYNYPDRTGHDLGPDLVVRLLEKHKNITGYKDTVPGMDHTRQIIAATQDAFPDFAVFCGYDENFAHCVLSGGAGCIGALSNLTPETCMAWVKAFADNDLAAVSKIQQEINKLMQVYTLASPFIALLKTALNQRGLKLGTNCTYPGAGVSQAQLTALEQIIQGLPAGQSRPGG